ncbi:hypothetical protein Asal01_00866 [Fodinibius salicampi]
MIRVSTSEHTDPWLPIVTIDLYPEKPTYKKKPVESRLLLF